MARVDRPVEAQVRLESESATSPRTGTVCNSSMMKGAAFRTSTIVSLEMLAEDLPELDELRVRRTTLRTDQQ